jgi:hypothetical protein
MAVHSYQLGRGIFLSQARLPAGGSDLYWNQGRTASPAAEKLSDDPDNPSSGGLQVRVNTRGYMKIQKILAFVLIPLSLWLSRCGLGQLSGPTITPTPTFTSTPPPSPTFTPSLTPSPTFTPSLTPSPTFTLTPMPVAYETMNVNDYHILTVYWKRDLWENAIRGNTVLTEDFEKDEADYGELGSPYLTGNGFILEGGSCPAQILKDKTLLDSGNILHFRDFGCGLTFIFPNDTAVTAFGFDYKPSEAWNININDLVIAIPGERKGFVGIVFLADFPKEFNLSSHENAQGGLSVDNISYIPIP